MANNAQFLMSANAFVARLRAWLVPALLLACFLSSSAEEAALRMVQPPDDLPSALIGGYRVDFTRNGAFVVSKDGHCLFDGGLVYAMPGWKEWGTQIRRASPGDTWRLDSKDAAKLVTQGSLYDFKRNKHFSFVQEAKAVPGGLKLSYEITPLAERRIGTCGVALHFPIAETAGAEAAFWPGFATAVMPDKLDQSRLYRGTARGATVFVAGSPRVSVVGNGNMSWSLFDYRAWNVNAYWLIGSDYRLARSLSKGEKGSLSFEVRLGPAVAQRVAIGAGECETDAYGRAAVYLAGRKVAEGGLVWDGEPVKWLHEAAYPAAAPAWHCIAPDGPSATVNYSVELAPERESSASLRYTVSRSAPTAPGGELHFVLAVPTSETLHQPTERAVQKGTGSEGQTGSDRAEPLYAVAVAWRERGSLTLEALAPWTIRSAVIAGTECYLLSIPTRRAKDGDATAWVRLGLESPVAGDDGGLTK